MLESNLKDVFDEFQREAVDAIVQHYSNKKNGRYLLVIPTGGGKTWTTVKAINQLYEKQVLSAAEDRVLWITHRIELENQAKVTFEKYAGQVQEGGTSYDSLILYEHDLKKIRKRVTEPSISLVVIDEAHHSKASSYQPIFLNTSVGVLGLTATPSRHDGRALDFEKECYSIGFPDLITKRIILDPIWEPIETKHIDRATDLDDVDKEKLNNKERNSRIIKVLHERSKKYNKVVIYVGTEKHVKDLYQLIKSSPLASVYPAINWILGGPSNNSRDLDRETFIEEEKSQKRSILINVEVLTEGYDDPTIDTVVIACPVRSTLKLMQAVGRAVRRHGDKKAYVVEVEDDLPNIGYRFTNRWLYSDISDTLEPVVIDQTYFDNRTFTHALELIYNSPDTWVEEIDRLYPTYDEDERYSLVLFRVYLGDTRQKHLPVLLSSKNRLSFKQRFDYLSERLAHQSDVFKRNADWAFSRATWRTIGLTDNDKNRNHVWDAMKFSGQCIANSPKKATARIQELKPWITFVSFRFRALELKPDLLEFMEEMTNKDLLLEDIKRKNFERGSNLIKLPLPLGGFKGLIVNQSTFIKVKSILTGMEELRRIVDGGDYLDAFYQYFASSDFPIELRYKECLPIIVREHIDYFREL